MKRIFILLMLLLYGCTSTSGIKKVEKPLNEEPLTTPFYHKGSIGFQQKNILPKSRKNIEDEKEARRKKNRERIERRVKELTTGIIKRQLNIFDAWLPPAEDPSLADALTYLPKDKFGYPDWVAAVNEGVISPRSSIPRSKKVDIEGTRSTKIIFKINDRLMANVLFPHSTHTYWLSCKSCHPKPFVAKRGANKFEMKDIWAGKYCGKCHGKVAFVPKGFANCQRCHRIKKKTLLPEGN